MRKKIIFGVFISLVLLVIYAPLLLILIFSFSENSTMSLGNFDFGFGLFRDLFAHRDIMPAFRNSLILATVSAGIATIIGTMACLTILHMSNRKRRATIALNNTPLITADIVIAFALSLFFTALGIFNQGWFTLIVSHTLITLPIVAIMVLPRLKAIDPNLFEASMDLGATPTRAFWGTLVPQLIPAMVIAFLLGFTFSMNDFIISFHNNGGGEVMTISMIVYTARGINYLALFRALSTIMIGIVITGVLLYNLLSWRRNKRKKKLLKNY